MKTLEEVKKKFDELTDFCIDNNIVATLSFIAHSSGRLLTIDEVYNDQDKYTQHTYQNGPASVLEGISLTAAGVVTVPDVKKDTTKASMEELRTRERKNNAN